MRAPPAPRSESMAYPRASTSTYLSRLQFACRHNFRGVLATVAFLTILGFLASDALHDFRTNNDKQDLKSIFIVEIETSNY